MWVYIPTGGSGCRLYTVGHYNPKGEWVPEMDFDTPEAAAERVHWLNGGEAGWFVKQPDNSYTAEKGEEWFVIWDNNL